MPKHTKRDIIRMVAQANLAQVHRENVGKDAELYIADGFVEPRKLNYTFANTLMDDEDREEKYPWGAYLTPWFFFYKGVWKIGNPIWSDPFENPGYSQEVRQQMRIGKALDDVVQFVKDWNSVREDYG